MGFACAATSRIGRLPRLPPSFSLKGAVAVVLLTELAAAAAGFHTHRTGNLPFPDALYPEKTGPLAVTQTVQLTAYATSALLSATFLLGILLTRRHRARNQP